MNENVKEDTHLTLACLYAMATKGNFQNHKSEISQIMQKVLDLDRAIRKELKLKELEEEMIGE